MDSKELEFNKNEDKMLQRIAELQRRLKKIYEGGGKKRIEKEHEKGNDIYIYILRTIC